MVGCEMPSGNVASGAQPVTLRRWRVVEVVTHGGVRTRHVSGHDTTSDDGRASGAIVAFDLQTMTATTTGSVRYRLVGLPGNSRKAQAVWEQWCTTHGVISERDVTNDYMDPDDVSTRQFVALNDSAFSAKPK